MELNTDHFWPYFLVYPLSFGQILFLYIFIWMLSLDVLFYSIWYNIELYFYVSIELVFWILWNSTFMYVFFISYSWYLLLTLSVITIYVLSYVFVLFLESCCDLLFCWQCLWPLFLPIVSAFFDSAVFENGIICFLVFGTISQVGEYRFFSTSNDIHNINSRQILSTADKLFEMVYVVLLLMLFLCIVVLYW